MPILIRIILQRLLVFVFSILAFFGINPDLSIPSEQKIEEAQVAQEERVKDILQKQETPESSSNKPEDKVVQEIENKITEIQKEFTQTITQPVIESAKEIIPTSLVYNQEDNVFDIKNVVVNIVCLEKTKTYTRLSSGSGVIVSPSGIILTNAHVTYPFLKSSQFDSSTYSCSIRRENIPNFGYKAELVYYPIDWLNQNKEIIKDPSPVGTGENDYAFLHITSALGPTPKSSGFAFAATDTLSSDLKTETPITIAGYPSSNSGVFELDTQPGLKIAQSKIIDFFTFNTRSYDVLQTGVNTVAHRGSSGGGIFKDKSLFGIIVTTNSNSQGSYINALTLPYIKTDFENDTGIDFHDFVSSSHDLLKMRFDVSYKEELKKIISEN